MRHRQSLVSSLVVAALLGSALSGCIVVPAHQPAYYPQQQSGPVVNVAPPPPQAEYVGAPPVAGYIWLAGFWAWEMGRHVWTAGHWEAPRPGHRWVPHSWVKEGNGWRQQGGRWERH